MNKLLIFLASFLVVAGMALAQEIPFREVKSDVNEVTVFSQGAQVTRKKTVEVPQGVSVLKFTGLSPFIDAKSVQVKVNGNMTVLSVNHQQNYLDKAEKSKELTSLETRLKQIADDINLENTYLQIISEELEFLKQNRQIGSGAKEVNLTNLKEASAFYGASVKTLKLGEIEHNKNIEAFGKQKLDIENQMRTITSKKEYPVGEILVKVDAKSPGTSAFELSYLVNNASWFPSYDIRAKSISDPVELVYKANVQQDSKEDWNNVKLKFSSSNPNKTGLAPELKTYLLGYNIQPPVYNQATGIVSGRVFDSATNEGLPGVNVVVEGSTIGTVTNAEGNYSIALPNGAGILVFSYIGFETQRMPVAGSMMNVALMPQISSLNEVQVIGYGTQRKTIPEMLQGRVAGIEVKNANDIKIRGFASMAVPSQVVEKQTTVDFEIKTPYNILSDNKSYAVVMEDYYLPADYLYYCVPKVDKDAFLIANVVDWEKYSLMEGEANIFFEDTYVGKSLLDVRYASDTLKISLGRDKNVSVNREKSKEFTTRQFIGSKKEETIDWTITVRNNKSLPIHMMLLDQAPISTSEDIEVEVQKTSNGIKNAETGEIRWIFDLDTKQKKDFELKYSVKYSKYLNLSVE